MLKFIGLSGTTGVTENLYLYEYHSLHNKGKEIIMVDCGVGFPESAMYGVDLVLPDFGYLKNNKDYVKAILITHGHEDHIGALPYLFKDVQVPIYATKLVARFIEEKFEEHSIKNYKITIINPEKSEIKIGNFTIHPFRISHSIPDGVGFAIRTPEGQVFHVADYKFDWTPVVGEPFDINHAAVLASDGVDILVSDSLGSLTPGYTESEKKIESQIESIVRKTKGRIFFTTVSSNISRIQQAINVAQKVGRKVAFIGLSIDKKAQITQELGYLKIGKGVVVNPRQLRKSDRRTCMYIIAGGYGQEGSALYRVARGEHKVVRIEKGDRVVFSSDPAPPGTKELVDSLVDKFIAKGVHVNFYDTQEDLHVSGHGSQEDIKLLFALTKPRYLIPVGGTVRHNRGYTELAEEMGIKAESVFELSPGEMVSLENGKAKRAGSIPIRTILVDGLGIGDVGNVVLADRKRLSTDGVVSIIIEFEKNTNTIKKVSEITSRGFVFEKQNTKFLHNASVWLFEKLRAHKADSKDKIIEKATKLLEDYFQKETGRRPVVIPQVIVV